MIYNERPRRIARFQALRHFGDCVARGLIRHMIGIKRKVDCASFVINGLSELVKDVNSREDIAHSDH